MPIVPPTDEPVDEPVADERSADAPTSALSHPLSDAMFEAVAERFRALSQAPRLKLLEALLTGNVSVSELVARTGLSQANASKHLAILAQAGFVVRRRQGTSVLYGLADDLPERLCAEICGRVVSDAERGARRLRAGAAEHPRKPETGRAAHR